MMESWFIPYFLLNFTNSSWIVFANLTWICDDVSIFSKVYNAPRPQKFFEEYVKLSKAAIFRGAIKDTKAFKIWEDSYMREHYGDLEVRLEGKKEKVFVSFWFFPF